jgi:hypothetical protein
VTIQLWGEYKPDVSDLKGNTSRVIENVVPRGDGYGPVADITAYTSALPAACRGSFRALASDGSIRIFAGTATKLYLMDNSDQTWTNVSKTAGAFDYSLPDVNKWEFAQYDDFVVAVQPGNVPQVYEIGTDTYFGDLGGSPPTATHVAVVNEFLLLTGLVSNRGRAQWSARSNIEAWTAGTDESDFQDFPDGGEVKPVAGGEHSALVLQEYGMRRMTYQPGNPVIFSFDRISEDIGIIAPYSVVKAGQRTFFISNAGFQQSIDGAVPVPIGKERVDKTFISEWDDNQLQLTVGFPDPRGTRIFWAYKTAGGDEGLFNKILCYDWLLDRWSAITGIAGEHITALAQVGQTLEGLDALEGATFTADTTDTDATLTNVSSFAGLYVGMTIIGTGIPANTTISSMDVGTSTIEMSQNATATNAGVTIIASGSIDSLELSLDAFAAAFGREISVFNSAHVMGFLHGDNLEATLETAEQGEPRQQTFVSGFHPITDAENVYGQVSAKQTIGATRVWNTEAAMDARGLIPARVDTRYYRCRQRIPAGEVWTYTAGVEPVAQPTGNR